MSVPIKTAVFEYLQSDAELVALIGARLHPNAVMHGTGALPYVTYRRTDYDPAHHMGGASGLAYCELTFEAFAESSMTAGAIGERLRGLLDSLWGVMGTTDGGVHVQRCKLTNALDDYVEPVDGDDIGRHRTELVFDVHYLESIPDPPASLR